MTRYRCLSACCEGAGEGVFWQPSRRRFLAAAGAAAASAFLPAAPALATPSGAVYHDLWKQPRALTLYRKQTGERGTIEYWRDGRYQMDGWYQLLHLLRDVDAGVAMHYDPLVIDLIWGCQEWARRDTGRLYVFRLTDGARTEKTNRLTRGAAELSEHKKGRAADGRLEGLPLSTYAAAARFFQVGGVGLYSTHVHVDSGRVRNWSS